MSAATVKQVLQDLF